MIPPSQLPSTDSLDGLTAATPDSDPTNLVCSLNCAGGRCAPHCAQRFATARCYVTLLVSLFLLLGFVRGYLAGLAYLIGDLFGLPDIFVEVLLVGAETVQGISSILVAHFGARSHRPSWLGAPAFLHAGACFAALVPFITHGRAHWLPPVRNGTNEYLCELVAPLHDTNDVETCWTTMVVLVAVQLTAGIAWAALLTHGIAYLDDNVDSEDSPALLGGVLGADRLGPPIGQVLAFVCASRTGDVTAGGEVSKIWWLGWPILGALLLAAAVLMAMFPKRLPSAAVRERANFILEVVCRRVRIDEQPQDIDAPTGLFSTIKRLLKNPIVGLLTLFLMFLYAPLHFFAQYENRYLESVYFIPEPEYSGGVFKDQWTSRVTTGFLKPPIILMTMLLSGMIISRKRPRSSSLAMWNIVVAAVTAAVFFTFIFLSCPVHITGMTGGNLEIEASCNKVCNCPSNIPFVPVCDRSGINTFYSPCHAGCMNVEYIDDIKLYNECKCLKYERKAKAGACSYSNCTSKWVVFQSLGVFISGLVGTCVVGSVLLCFRSVAVQDKMHAIAFIIAHIGATHLPGKFLFKFVTETTCIYWGGEYQCQLFDASDLALWFNLVCGILLLLAVLFGFLAWRHSKNIQLFKDTFDDPDAIELNEIRQKLNARLATPFTRRRRRNKHEDSSDEESDSNEGINTDSIQYHRGVAETEVLQPLRPLRPRQQRTESNEVQQSANDDQRTDNIAETEVLQPTQPLQSHRQSTGIGTERNEIQESANDEQRTNNNVIQQSTDDEGSENSESDGNVRNEQSQNDNRRIWRATVV